MTASEATTTKFLENARYLCSTLVVLYEAAASTELMTTTDYAILRLRADSERASQHVKHLVFLSGAADNNCPSTMKLADFPRTRHGSAPRRDTLHGDPSSLAMEDDCGPLSTGPDLPSCLLRLSVTSGNNFARISPCALNARACHTILKMPCPQLHRPSTHI